MHIKIVTKTQPSSYRYVIGSFNIRLQLSTNTRFVCQGFPSSSKIYHAIFFCLNVTEISVGKSVHNLQKCKVTLLVSKSI